MSDKFTVGDHVLVVHLYSRTPPKKVTVTAVGRKYVTAEYRRYRIDTGLDTQGGARLFTLSGYAEYIEHRDAVQRLYNVHWSTLTLAQARAVLAVIDGATDAT